MELEGKPFVKVYSTEGFRFISYSTEFRIGGEKGFSEFSWSKKTQKPQLKGGGRRWGVVGGGCLT